MYRARGLLLAVVIIAAACGVTDSVETTTPPAGPATTAPTTTAVTVDTPPEPWPADIAQQLVALEETNDGEWTVSGALEAMELIRTVLVDGIESVPPIDTTRLTAYLAQNFDQVPGDRWEIITASGVNALPAAFYQTEDERLIYQRIAEDVNREFEGLTGHTLGIPIYIALTDMRTPMDLYAGTVVQSDNVEAFRGWFIREDLFEKTKDAFEDLTADGGTACVIVLSQFLRAWTPERQASGILHEVIHCHQQTIHPGGRDGFWVSPREWMDEGYAAYAGEARVGGTLNSSPWWNDYLDGGVGAADDGFLLFAGSYNAMPFYNMLAAGGVDIFGQFQSWFRGLRANGVSDVNRYSSMTEAVAPELIAGWTASASRRDDFGTPWNSAGGVGFGAAREQRLPNVSRTGAEPRTYTADAGEQRYWTVQFNTDFEQPSLISISVEGLGTYRWDFGEWQDQYVTGGNSIDLSWCVGEDCVCEDGTSPAPGAMPAPIESGDRPILHAALFGAANQSTLTASVETLEDACDEEVEPPVDAGPLDACLFGTWNPDPEQFADLILTQYRGLGVTVTSLEGTIGLTFNADGSFAQDYVGVVGSGTIAGETGTAALAGGSFGTWTAVGGVITLSIEGGSVDVTLNGEGPGGQPVPGGTTALGGYTCGPTTLEIDPPEIAGGLLPFPTDWSKTG